MGTRDEELDRIKNYLRENMDYFCSPPPEGLGWPRPGGLPKYYLNNPEEWELDLQRVEALKKAARLRRVAEGGDLTKSRGMAAETREVLDSIRRMHQEGLTPAAIAEVLGVRERAIINVLALGPMAYDAGTSGSPVDPKLNAFAQTWGRTLQPGGHQNGNGNGNGHHQDGPL